MRMHYRRDDHDDSKINRERKLSVCNYPSLFIVRMEDLLDLSEYAKSLPELDKERYRQKLSVNICGQEVVLRGSLQA